MENLSSNIKFIIKSVKRYDGIPITYLRKNERNAIDQQIYHMLILGLIGISVKRMVGSLPKTIK